MAFDQFVSQTPSSGGEARRRELAPSAADPRSAPGPVVGSGIVSHPADLWTPPAEPARVRTVPVERDRSDTFSEILTRALCDVVADPKSGITRATVASASTDAVA